MSKNKDCNYKIDYKFNKMYFDESNRMHFDAKNSDFWAAMQNLHKLYPNNKILIEPFIITNKGLVSMYEDVKITCDSIQVKAIADDLYSRHYYIVPMKLYKEFEGREDVLKELIYK